MAEPETQTEDETVTSDFLREARTGTSGVTKDATSDDQISAKYKSTDYESENENAKKKRSRMDVGWARGNPHRYAESRSNPRKKNERETMSDVAILPGAEAIEETFPLRECFPPGGFQLEHRANTTVGRRGRTRIWKSMRRQPTRIFRGIPRKESERSWPSVQPCLTRDAAIKLETREKGKRRWRRDVFLADESEFLLREQRSDFANCKELGHVRELMSRPESKLKLSAECATGERPGLVNGDYVIVELPSGRVYANVVLHGQKGMHLLEMGLRERQKTWKFCFFQAIVALLARTQLSVRDIILTYHVGRMKIQLCFIYFRESYNPIRAVASFKNDIIFTISSHGRYKYAWSANIDYIYDHAWMLFTHIGTINVKAKQRLDDVVVYNYKYSVEIEFIEEMKDIEVLDIDIVHKEKGLRRQITLNRKDPLRVRVALGCQKVTDSGYVSLHDDAKQLEEWLGKLIGPRYRDCILRTSRFSLAFWQDGLFWYLYNPYRCDEYGFWSDNGRACIVKFCSADSLRRHLMVLLLRGHAYLVVKSRLDCDLSQTGVEGFVTFDVQLFRVSFHCCQLDNLKLLQRGASKPRRADECPSDSFETEDETDREKDEEDDPKEPRERVTWLRRCRATTWGKCASANRKRPGSVEVTAAGKAKWHQYYVEEPNRLFSLWGEIHITDDIFDEANRGMQTYACYVVCAGMTRIMAPEYWSPKTLDAIVVCGDRYYTRSKHEAELESVGDGNGTTSHSSKYLSDRFDIGEILFEARMLPAVRGKLYAESSECLWRTLERVLSSYHFAVLTCENACLGLFKFCGAYYVCDVNSFGPPHFQYGHGAACLLRATSFRKFVTVLVLIVGSPERSRFGLNPIEILRIVEADTALESRAKTRGRRHRFGKFVGKMPGKLPRFVFDGQKKRGRKK